MSVASKVRFFWLPLLQDLHRDCVGHKFRHEFSPKSPALTPTDTRTRRPPVDGVASDRGFHRTPLVENLDVPIDG